MKDMSIQKRAAEEAAMMSNADIANTLADHAVWYEEYTADGADGGDNNLLYQLTLEAAIINEAANRLASKKQ